MSAFDPQAFLDATVDAPLVKRPPLPVGEYTGVVKDPVAREWVGQKDPTKSGVAVDFPIEVFVPLEIRNQLDLTTDTITVKYGIMLDLKPDGSLDLSPGKNGKLRAWREALDMNKPGDKYSHRAAVGRTVKVRIKHREYQGELYEDADSVGRA